MFFSAVHYIYLTKHLIISLLYNWSEKETKKIIDLLLNVLLNKYSVQQKKTINRYTIKKQDKS